MSLLNGISHVLGCAVRTVSHGAGAVLCAGAAYVSFEFANSLSANQSLLGKISQNAQRVFDPKTVKDLANNIGVTTTPHPAMTIAGRAIIELNERDFSTEALDQLLCNKEAPTVLAIFGVLASLFALSQIGKMLWSSVEVLPGVQKKIMDNSQ